MSANNQTELYILVYLKYLQITCTAVSKQFSLTHAFISHVYSHFSDWKEFFSLYLCD